MNTPEQTAEDLRARDEYDAYGPWVVRVRETADVPPLYWPARLDPRADVVVKFPRPEARRDLLPGMDLYDAVIAVRADALVVLRRADAAARATGGASGFSTHVVPYGELAAIVDSVDLLDARLEIHSVGGDVHRVAYNGSSKRMVSELIDAIRLRIRTATATATATTTAPATGGSGVPTPEPGTPPRLAMDDLGRKDVALVSLFDQISRGGGAQLLAAAGRSTVRFSGGVRRAVGRVWPTSVQGMVVAGGDGEVQVLSRRLPFRRGGRPETSLERTIIVAPLVTEVETQPHPALEAVTLVTVRSGRAALEFAVPTGSPLERVLRRVGRR